MMKHIVLFLQESEIGNRLQHGLGKYAGNSGQWRFYRCNFAKSVSALQGVMGHIPVDGILVQLWDEKTIEIVKEYQVPTLNVGNAVATSAFPTIRADNRLIGQLAAEHFIERGIHNLAVFRDKRHFGFSVRCDGFLEKAAEARGNRCAVLSSYVPKERHNTAEDELRYYINLLESLPRPVGIFSMNDYQGETLLAAAQQLGRRIPEEVAVLGTDNVLKLCELSSPYLSSIDLNLELTGYKAMQLLDSMLKGQAPPKNPILIPPKELVTRASTDVLALEDEDVMMAVRFIREHAQKPIDVEDVLDKITISRRTLERRFRDQLGHSVLQEINQARMRKARKMLTQTKASIMEVALECGFTSQSYFCQAFRRSDGMTPTSFRRRS